MRDTEMLWRKHIGSHRVHAGDELERIWVLSNDPEKYKISRREIYQLYLRTKHWYALRRRIIARDGCKCVKCGSVEMLQVDHIRYPDILGREKEEDLQTVCYRCHAEKSLKVDLMSHGRRSKRKVESVSRTPLFTLLRTNVKVVA